MPAESRWVIRRAKKRISGPLITPEAAERADRAGQRIHQAWALGVYSGGKRVKGSFYEPTIIVDVTADMPVMKDEVFGPVAPVCSFKDIDDGDRDGERFAVRAAVDRVLVEHQQRAQDCPQT